MIVKFYIPYFPKYSESQLMVYCLSDCRQNEFDCGDGSCISHSQICDGKRNCKSGIDELDCPTGTDLM